MMKVDLDIILHSTIMENESNQYIHLEPYKVGEELCEISLFSLEAHSSGVSLPFIPCFN